MQVELITKEDLTKLKTELLSEIKSLLSNKAASNSSEWLKSNQVMKLLGISAGTLQTLRINGTVPFSKIGGVIYYNVHDIEKLFKSNRFQNS